MNINFNLHSHLAHLGEISILRCLNEAKFVLYPELLVDELQADDINTHLSFAKSVNSDIALASVAFLLRICLAFP